MVERWRNTSSRIPVSIYGQMEPSRPAWLSSPVLLATDETSSILATGTTIRICGWRIAGGLTTVTGRLPPRNAATSLAERTVAERPIRCAEVWSSASSRSRLNARCAPRLLPATAWTSSIITVSTPRSVSRAREVSIR
ncbi:Uncharacterised protein [Shigella sonnei]|nr:Uncharacterised protein [Shigella sonnei]CSP58976.1 Uncharacterised protein [Shigella sonnei]CSP79404.1 Uncharacterised protein [Shigella sonnei]